MENKILNIIQGPSGIGKNDLIKRLKKEGKKIINNISKYNILNKFKDFPLFWKQEIIFSNYKNSILDFILSNEKEIFITTSAETIIIYSNILLKNNKIKDWGVKLLIEDMKTFFKLISNICNEKNINLKINYINLYIVDKNLLNNDDKIINEYNNLFYENKNSKINIAKLNNEIKKIIKLYSNNKIVINNIRFNKNKLDSNWENIPLNEIFN